VDQTSLKEFKFFKLQKEGKKKEKREFIHWKYKAITAFAPEI